MIDDTLVQRSLFGGAMQLHFPLRLVDISDFRPVPDHQEVFADASLDQSLVVEIVVSMSSQQIYRAVVQEHQPVPDAEAASFFFHDQAANNEAQHAQIDMQYVLSQQDVPDLPPDCFKAILVGQQAVTKGRQGSDALNKVHIILCCIRLPQHGSDLLLTLNSPIYISEKSAAAEHAGAGFKGAHLTAPALFKQIISSLRINDWGLFGDRPGA
ncbi:Ran guanine nucleotide release factor [Chlorella vulgaris]